MITDRSNCVVITPYLNRIEPEVELGLRELERRGFVVWRECGFSAIDYGRSVLATRAIEQGFKETLWIDSDIGFHPEEVDLLRSLSWHDILTHGKGLPKERARHAIEMLSHQFEEPGIVCGLYVKKNLKEFATSFPLSVKTLTLGKDGRALMVSHAGTGMFLVRDWTYKRVKDYHQLPLCNTTMDHKLVPYFLPMVLLDEKGNAFYLCEDYAFCERARAAGIPIIADTRMRLFHYGSYGYSWEDVHKASNRYDSYDIVLNRASKSSGVSNNERFGNLQQ